MKVYLYQFGKTPKSTIHPLSASGLEVDGSWKFGTNLLHPSIAFSLTLGSLIYYNTYMEVPSMRRFYFITDWSYLDGEWVAQCDVDVMGTYADEIKNSTQYILRGNYLNTDIVDTLYPLQSAPLHRMSTPETKPFAESLDAGMYVMGLLGGGRDAVTFYIMGPGAFHAVCDRIFNIDQYYTGITADEISENLYKSIVDPGKYIQSVRWYPFQAYPTDAEAAEFVQLGFWRWPVTNQTDFSNQIWKLTNQTIYTHSITITLPATAHPDFQRLGRVANIAPYTLRTLDYPPFGHFVLDTPSLVNPGSIILETSVDLSTGTARLVIRHNDVFKNEDIITTSQTGFGVDIPVRSSTYDLSSKSFSMGSKIAALDAGLNFMGNLMSAGVLTDSGEIVQSGLTENGSGLANVASPLLAASVRQEVHGELSSLISYRADIRVDTWEYRPADENTVSAGRPICQTMKIKDLNTGYAIVQNPKFENGKATRTEIERIQNYLATGFYKV